MIKLFIDHMDQENGVVCVSLTSLSGGKIAGEKVDGSYRVHGITRKFPVKLVLHEGDEYFVTDSDVKLIREKINELTTDIGKSDNRSKKRGR